MPRKKASMGAPPAFGPAETSCDAIRPLVHVADPAVGVAAHQRLASLEHDSRAVLRGIEVVGVPCPVPAVRPRRDECRGGARALVDVDAGVGVGRDQLFVGLEEVRMPSSENPSMLASNAPLPPVGPVDSQVVTLWFAPASTAAPSMHATPTSSTEKASLHLPVTSTSKSPRCRIRLDAVAARSYHRSGAATPL